jgi:hypothetical protein
MSGQIGKLVCLVCCPIRRCLSWLLKQKIFFAGSFETVWTAWRNIRFHLLGRSHMHVRSGRFWETVSLVCNGIHWCPDSSLTCSDAAKPTLGFRSDFSNSIKELKRYHFPRAEQSWSCGLCDNIQWVLSCLVGAKRNLWSELNCFPLC